MMNVYHYLLQKPFLNKLKVKLIKIYKMNKSDILLTSIDSFYKESKNKEETQNILKNKD